MSPNSFFIAYSGLSMQPTLIEPELLEVMPYDGSFPRAGDVIFFTHANTGTPLVHRVVRVTSAGLITRGDNVFQDDEGACLPAAVRGRVVAAWRGQRRRVVWGGRVGKLWTWSLRGWHCLLVFGIRLLSKPYHALARTGMLRSWLPPPLRPRVLVFQNGNSQQFRLVIGRHVVGTYDTARRVWSIQPPYLLFVDEAALPPGKGPASSTTPAKT